MYEKAKRCAECSCLEPGEGGYTCHFYGKMIDDIKNCTFVKEVANMVIHDEEVKHPSLSSIVCKLMDEEKVLFKRKSGQYGIGDELANFRDCAYYMGLDPECLDSCWVALKGMMNKHVSFVERSDELTDKVDESLGDIVVYCLIARGMLRLKKGEE